MTHPYCYHPHPLAFGHRGAPAHCPENTLVSFQHALEAGVDGLELDIHPTRDGVPVVIHDATVGRTTGGSGRVSEMTLAELRQLDAGYRFTRDGGRTFPFRGRSVTIPTLEEVLELAGPARLNVDFKETSPIMEERVESLLERFSARDRVLVCSSSDHLAPRIRRRFPGMATSACVREVAKLVAAGLVGLGRLAVPNVEALQIPPSHLGMPVLTRRLIDVAHASGLAVHVWTINDRPGMLRCLELGVDGIMSDDPAVLVDVLRQAGKR